MGGEKGRGQLSTKRKRARESSSPVQLETRWSNSTLRRPGAPQGHFKEKGGEGGEVWEKKNRKRTARSRTKLASPYLCGAQKGYREKAVNGKGRASATRKKVRKGNKVNSGGGILWGHSPLKSFKLRAEGRAGSEKLRKDAIYCTRMARSGRRYSR